jgi:hypothetical protein
MSIFSGKTTEASSAASVRFQPDSCRPAACGGDIVVQTRGSLAVGVQ